MGGFEVETVVETKIRIGFQVVGVLACLRLSVHRCCSPEWRIGTLR